MAKFEHVEFYGTGGGCILFSALVNGSAWLATDFSTAAYYDENFELVSEDFLNDVPYEKHLKTPSDPLPTWKEIFNAICENVPSGIDRAEFEMKNFDMDSVCTQNWEYPSDEWDD